MIRIKVLILGVDGMLGHVICRCLFNDPNFDVHATTMLSEPGTYWFSPELSLKIIHNLNAYEFDNLIPVINSIKPDIIINCIAIIKPIDILNNPIASINLNALLPHKLAEVSKKYGTRIIQISSDIVFDGKSGMYKEDDQVNISDRYGMTKYLGEIVGPNCLTIRTSIIGHELNKKSNLVEWFLSQRKSVEGYTKAIYTGLPTIELANVIKKYVLPNNSTYGVYHISSDPISKFDLLNLIATKYQSQIKVEPNNSVIVDRSLNSDAFRTLTGYTPKTWPELINSMYMDYLNYKGKLYV